MGNVPVFGDPKWIATAKSVGHSRGRTGRKAGQPWADIRGRGPDGKTCKTCRFLVGNRRSKTYYKCGKVRQTHGPGTDIRLRDPACMLYEEEISPVDSESQGGNKDRPQASPDKQRR